MNRSLLWMVALGAAGCGGDFVPFNELASLRILAIQSEPVAPAVGETTTLTPLVYTSPGEDVESYAWSYCPYPGAPNDGHPCLVTEEEVAELAGTTPDQIPPFDLGSDPTAAFANGFEAEALATLCEGSTDSPALYDCAEGFPIQVRLTVTSGSEEVTVVREVRLRFDDAMEPHANPSIDGLVAVIDGDEEAIDAAGTVELPRDEATVIRAVIPESAAEEYTTPDEGEDARERLIMTWFVETGDLDTPRTGFIEDSVPLEEAVENEWTPAKEGEFEADEAELLLVVRDDRGGVTWLGGLVTLVEAP